MNGQLGPEQRWQYQTTLKGAATYARASGLVVHVVLPREPGMAEQAWHAAEQAGVGMTMEVGKVTIAFRFAVPPSVVTAEPDWFSDEQLSPN